MTRFITEKKDLLNIFSKAARSASPSINEEDVEPILEKALNNFKREMKQPIENFGDNNTPNEMKAQIFNILAKHFVMCLMNEKIFIENKDISEISKRIEDLLE